MERRYFYLIIFQFSSVAQLCLTLCDPMDCSTPGLPNHHQLPELTQTHVHRVGDAIQPSHPLSSPSPPAPNLSSIRVFSNESAPNIRWSKYWGNYFTININNGIQLMNLTLKEILMELNSASMVKGENGN